MLPQTTRQVSSWTGRSLDHHWVYGIGSLRNTTDCPLYDEFYDYTLIFGNLGSLFFHFLILFLSTFFISSLRSNLWSLSVSFWQTVGVTIIVVSWTYNYFVTSLRFSGKLVPSFSLQREMTSERIELVPKNYCNLKETESHRSGWAELNRMAPIVWKRRSSCRRGKSRPWKYLRWKSEQK